MKALSIRADYAMEIFKGIKKIEYRTWTTHYRGSLLICSTAQKVHGGLPGYAICVVKITDIIKYGDRDYGWQLAPFSPTESYWIKPFKVKGQRRLFNVDDQLIQPAPVTGPADPNAQKWFLREIAPLIY